MDELLPEIKKFKEKFATSVLDGGDIYDLDHVINLDETSIKRDAPSEYTIEERGVKRIQIKTTGSEKTCYTLILAVSFTGEKLPATLI
jgi:hypothetical protein